VLTGTLNVEVIDIQFGMWICAARGLEGKWNVRGAKGVEEYIFPESTIVVEGLYKAPLRQALEQRNPLITHR